MKIMIDDSSIYDEINVFDSWYRIAGTMQLRNQTQKEAFNSIKIMIKLLFSDSRYVIYSCWSNFPMFLLFLSMFWISCITEPKKNI